MNRPITCALSPNTEHDDILHAVRLTLRPWRWKKGSATRDVEAWFRRYYTGSTAVSFNSGRAALMALLLAFGIGAGDEVIVQAFTCIAVPNSVSWTGAVPIYADIDPTYNLDPLDVQKKITKKTRAIVVQHT